MARLIQQKRFEGMEGIHSNSQLPARMLREVCRITEAGNQLLKTAMDKLGLSARAYDRILKVSRTIADLDQSPDIRVEHLSEAINYRSLDRDSWGR
jgi:magnesium chelatase family protein